LEFERLKSKTQAIVDAASTPRQSMNASPAPSQRTPPMLPSPASIAPASSANSTPTGRDAETPGATDPPPPTTRPPPPPSSVPNAHGHASSAAQNIVVPTTVPFLSKIEDSYNQFDRARRAMSSAQSHLTLQSLAKHFPVTFKRITGSTLRQEDELVPDIEDEEGELFWPGAPTGGQGLGWVCLLGKAMIKEFGRTVGYRGYDGCVLKPVGGASASSSSSSLSSAASAPTDNKR
jgi:hypothetical protein